MHIPGKALSVDVDFHNYIGVSLSGPRQTAAVAIERDHLTVIFGHCTFRVSFSQHIATYLYIPDSTCWLMLSAAEGKFIPVSAFIFSILAGQGQYMHVVMGYMTGFTHIAG